MKKAEPDKERLWRQIESNFKTDNLYLEHNRDILIRAIRSLPDLKPEKDIWALLQNDINVYIPGTDKRKRYIYLSRIAATMIILISIYIVLNQLLFNKELKETENQAGDESVESFFSRICSTNPDKCTEADFIALKSEILELYNEKSEITNSIYSNPEDADIHRVIERINGQILNLKFQIADYVE
jgi:hypothetical protein